MKPVRIFRHVACEPPGYLGTFLEERGRPCEVICLDAGIAVPGDLDDVAGLVFMGGPGDVNKPPGWMQEELALIRRAAAAGVPQLGICLGAQLISKALGGSVMPGRTLEVGWHSVELLGEAAAQDWFAGLPARFEVFQWHAHTFSIPPGAVALARSDCAENQAFALGNILAMQFHLEMTPAAVRELTQRYGSDMAEVSDCVQDAAAVTADLEARTRRLYGFADVVYEHWLRLVREFDAAV
jgi:GMP synthase-like glutamine amidotransferase